MICSEPQWLTPIEGYLEAHSARHPASLLVLSAFGDPRPALLAALGHDDRLLVRFGSLPGSIDAVDDGERPRWIRTVRGAGDRFEP